MLKSASKIMSFFAVGTILIGSASTAAAVDMPHKEPNASNSTCAASNGPSNTKDTTQSPDKAELLKEAKGNVSKGKIHAHGGVDRLDLDNTKVTTVKSDDGESFDLVTVPYSNEGEYNYLSNITVAYKTEDHSSPIGQSETLYTKGSHNKFNVQVFKDDQLVKDEGLDIDYVDGATLQANQNVPMADPDAPELQGWGEKTACIGAILGVNGVVAGLIGSTCATACGVEPIGAAVYAACVGGIATLGTGDIAGVVECFKL